MIKNKNEASRSLVVTTKSSTKSMNNILEETTKYIRETFANHDASHDYAHVQRVRNMAMLLAKQEGLHKITN